MRTQQVRLCEWEIAEPLDGSPLEGVRLAGNPAAQRLAEKLTGDGRIEILELARGLELRATSFVGRFALGGILVTILPKITGAPLMNLLRYAYRLRQLDLFPEVGYAPSQASLEDLLIYQLAAEATELIARGLHRDYRRTQSLLTSPRGRIDFGNYPQVAAVGGSLPCIHHPRSEDTLLNQALKGGLELASRITLDRELRCRVRRLAKTLVSLATPARLDATSFEKAWHSLDRRTRAYEPSLKLIRLLLQTQGAALAETPHTVTAAGFLFDMNRFFQELLSRFLSEHLAGCQVQDERRLRGMFSYHPAYNPQHRLSPSLRPDFLVLRKQRVVALLDAKYRDLWERQLPREMLYQLALYALGQESLERSATILYPTLEVVAREQVILVHDPFRGSAHARVILRPVNLLQLDQMLRGKGAAAHRTRSDFAYYLAFGEAAQTTKEGEK